MTDSQGPNWHRPDGPQFRYVARSLDWAPRDRAAGAATKSSMRPFVAAPILGWLCSGAGLVFGIAWLWVLGIVMFILGAVLVVICAAGWDSRTEPVAGDRTLVDWPADWPIDWPVNPRTNALSVSSLVLGIPFPPLAIAFGHIARAQIRRTGERGRRLALAGLTLGYGCIASAAVALLVFAV